MVDSIEKWSITMRDHKLQASVPKNWLHIVENICVKKIPIQKMVVPQKIYDYSNLYRIFYYDCPPVEKNVYHPLTKKCINFKKQPTYKWMTEFLDELKSKRKFALRLGFLAADEAVYTLKQESIKKLFNGVTTLDTITECDFQLLMQQKGVDMKIGIDIASLSYKRLVDQIILISGDSDFTPAAKLARQEGIDFILDPMGHNVNPSLLEHIDGLRSYYTTLSKLDSGKEELDAK